LEGCGLTCNNSESENSRSAKQNPKIVAVVAAAVCNTKYH